MSADQRTAQLDAPLSETTRTVTLVSWKSAGVLLAVTALYALLLLAVPHSGDTRFLLSQRGDFFQIPVIVLPAAPLAWACGAVMLAATAFVVLRTARGSRTPLWVVAVFAFAGLTGFLAWAGAGSPRDLSVVGLLGGAVLWSVPFVYGALGGVIGERAGVVNIAIEAQLLGAAFTAGIVSSVTDSALLGLAAAVLAGALVSLVLGLFAITYHVNQVIVGVVLNVLVVGLTSFLYSQVLQDDAATLNSTTRFSSIPIPVLSDIPVLGPVLFDQPLLIYLMFLAVPAVWYALNRTRWGLRLRAVGEHPKAADTVGIDVVRTRYNAVLVAGAVAGLGGAFYTTVYLSQFGENMTGGAGYIALAAVIFGKWDPVRAAFAGLLFGFASNLQNVLSVVGSPVPSQFMLMVPYVVTLLAVAGLVGRSRPPAASGEPYIKG
ncbi:simple sugar transport system permease protein [Promicromonospora umidemergens]|uniref:ABC transporter permease n=1 Tax=Promicromonospora umidemergens TaxID=629679 RepID=A0ABP8Y0G7_9MICO|nr:ABC transporter permease [Promicromonospora umidemergens]MCP2286363.1 simple sugar transport system permease protein [Promicromonospora umidemergens]